MKTTTAQRKHAALVKKMNDRWNQDADRVIAELVKRDSTLDARKLKEVAKVQGTVYLGEMVRAMDAVATLKAKLNYVA